MPRENRKRGKKHKKIPEDKPPPNQNTATPNEETTSHSWIIPNPHRMEMADNEAPFGFVDMDVKAYFRTIDVQIRDWQESQRSADDQEDVDPNEEKRLFFVAALTEMSGKEKQLATDADCSTILERMSYSMDDFVRRVFVDRLTGSYETLVRHRFASHVCQTFFTVASDTVSRECRGILPNVPDSTEDGELRTLTQLILDVCEELLPAFTSLILDPFASHVLRALILLLSPCISLSSPQSQQSLLRSKRSAAFKARQGPMKSVFTEENGDLALKSTPDEFRQAAGRFLKAVRDVLGANEVRALAADKVASPVLQILLEVEANQSQSDIPDSLMDRVLVGIITSCHKNIPVAEPSEYVLTLLRDPSSSHLLETLVSHAPPSAFTVLWSIYFKPKLTRLAIHPVANFVVAKAIERLSGDQLLVGCQELEGNWGKIVKSSRTGVLRAMIDRAGVLHSGEKEICEATCLAFNLASTEDRALFVLCALRLQPVQEYKSSAALSSGQCDQSEPQKTKSYRHDATDDPMEPKTQGAILLQSMLRLADPYNQIVLDSVRSLSVDELLAVAHHPTSSRVLDAILDSPTVPPKGKRGFVLSFIGHFHRLVDDRIGSRVGDRCWAFADTYLKEKIAKSLITQEQFLAGSYYGKYFARKLNLYLFQRNREEWRNVQSQSKIGYSRGQHSPPSEQTLHDTASESKKRKRGGQQMDEIDALFATSLGKKAKMGAPAVANSDFGSQPAKIANAAVRKDKAFLGVLEAIRVAPDKRGHGKKTNRVS